MQSVLVALQSNGNIGMIWCETIDDEARNMIKSDEHRFASEFRRLPRRFALKEKDFS
jgi:hypothetical protein